MPAAEVIAKGKAAGMTFSDKYVYSIRSKSPKRGRPKGKAGSKSKSGRGNAEEQFVDLALDLGLSRADAILGRLRTAVRSAAVG
jgi:hypothetical protein